eukprot:Nitzschia sp. Nitz4//scaffold118_size93875//72527//72823//NITZ4_004798-RA/size93875-processed-gene-0.65-mRNA-1//-1//CDS//3329533754//6945//frame0
MSSEQVAKLQAATDEAKAQLEVCEQALALAEEQLEAAKAKYKQLPPEEQATLQINDTELPELIETQLRAKNVLETVQARYATNQKYLQIMKAKLQASA